MAGELRGWMSHKLNYFLKTEATYEFKIVKNCLWNEVFRNQKFEDFLAKINSDFGRSKSGNQRKRGNRFRVEWKSSVPRTRKIWTFGLRFIYN